MKKFVILVLAVALSSIGADCAAQVTKIPTAIKALTKGEKAAEVIGSVMWRAARGELTPPIPSNISRQSALIYNNRLPRAGVNSILPGSPAKQFKTPGEYLKENIKELEDSKELKDRQKLKDSLAEAREPSLLMPDLPPSHMWEPPVQKSK